jgi:glycosyltransferase involved in cell wall biosynthesis
MVPARPLISFCIPTYNRALLLKEALDSIAGDAHGFPVEIVVSDNASTDGTPEVLEGCSTPIPIRYRRNDRNLGAAPNLLEAIRMARGEFLWILSDDDCIVPGIVRHVFGILETRRDLDYMFVPRMLVDIDLKPLPDGLQPPNIQADVYFQDGRELFIAYDGRMSDFMGFLSSTLIRRSLWEEIFRTYTGPVDNWIVFQVILRAVRGRVCCVAGRLGVLARVGNSPAGYDSHIWLEESIGLYLSAMRLGYPVDFCEEKIRLLFRCHSLKFILNKAEGLREGSLLTLGKGMGVKKFLDRRAPWYYISFLPPTLLRPFLWVRSLRRTLRPALGKVPAFR